MGVLNLNYSSMLSVYLASVGISADALSLSKPALALACFPWLNLSVSNQPAIWRCESVGANNVVWHGG